MEMKSGTAVVEKRRPTLACGPQAGQLVDAFSIHVRTSIEIKHRRSVQWS